MRDWKEIKSDEQDHHNISYHFSVWCLHSHIEKTASCTIGHLCSTHIPTLGVTANSPLDIMPSTVGIFRRVLSWHPQCKPDVLEDSVAGASLFQWGKRGWTNTSGPFLSCFNSESSKEFELTLFLVSLLCYLLDNNWFRLYLLTVRILSMIRFLRHNAKP